MSKIRETKASATPKSVLQLVQRFAQHLETYKRQTYNETQVRREFIDPLFKALGWDVDNQAGHAEAYKDVIHEDAIKVGGSTKAPDYCFRIGGVRKFFVEAKKPSIAVKDDPSPAYQLRRYAWTAKLPLAIVTDFEELAVYDCRIRPRPTDKPATARVKYITFDQYADRWAEIADVFSKEAILQGSFDKYAESNRRKRGTAEVDTEFLKEIERWRELLARNIALRNPGLSVRDLNYAVSKTIDRLIFLRMCEDRGVETYAQLRALLNGAKVYDRLRTVFRAADDRYNSGLFYFQQEKDRSDAPDQLTPTLNIDDSVLKDIIKGLYYPDCPYEFSVLPADILGQVYEQFLGKVIRLTKGHRAVVEEKPEVKKAGGVYYTPTYIVDYIVEHTVGKLLEGATVKWVATEKRKKVNRPRLDRPLRILDPACGSGSFLLGAYQYLLRWYLDYYTNNDPEEWVAKPAPPIHEVAPANPQSQIPNPQSTYRLSIAERKRILLDHIYGVDIDPQAVEVTKLSLLLKVLEGESQQTLDSQLRLFHDRALPDLAANIKGGNSLIGPDFYDGQQLDMFDEEERYRINVFDWETEFTQIMKAGGFDAVIGNPPYVFARDRGFTKYEKEYFLRYKHQSYQLHSFTLFTVQGYQLLQEEGMLGYIVPNNWLSIGTMRSFRRFLLTATSNLTIVNNLYKVFTGANVDTSIVLFRKSPPGDVCLAEADEPGAVTRVAVVPSAEMLDDPIIQYRLYRNRPAARLLDKIESVAEPLQSVATVRAGLKAYETGKGNPKQTDRMKKLRVYHSRECKDGSYRAYLDGKDVGRYWATWSGEFLSYGRNLAAPRDPQLFDGPRILVRQIPSRPPRSINGVLVNGDELNDINSMIVKNPREYALTYILGLINSRLLTFWFDFRFDKFQRAIFPQFKVNELATFPIRTIDATNSEAIGQHDCMVALVQQMLDLHKQLSTAKTPTDKTAIQRQIDATDRRIDQLVYELYGLTDDEIRIVEEATQ